jgi:short-subunit dehydrogenase
VTNTALIVGAGSGIQASFARLLTKDGYRVALASRDPAQFTRLANETNAAITCACDAANVNQQFARIG